LNRDSDARAQGNQRTHEWGGFQRSGGSGSSYRGGGFRGGRRR
jgi:hypothetical protein